MTSSPLGRLEQVSLRQIWTDEARDFTPWLAEADNLSVLAETIGTELELEAQERSVGPFRADILCKDLGNDSWVLIENQLEPTDHRHLGQLLTYAAGLQAVTIVWVSEKLRDEHRAALDWLNDITDERFRFFGLEVELWRIGSSEPAPRFHVISKPNDWSKSVARAARSIDNEAPSELKALQYEYWQGLNAMIEARSLGIRTRSPRHQHWTTFSVGRSWFHLGAKVNAREKQIGAELFIQPENAKRCFWELESDRAAIENEIGVALSWEELPNRKGSRVALYLPGADLMERHDWPRQHEWLCDTLVKFDKAFRPRVRALDIDDSDDIELDEAE